jgi:hypothetical protein
MTGAKHQREPLSEQSGTSGFTGFTRGHNCNHAENERIYRTKDEPDHTGTAYTRLRTNISAYTNLQAYPGFLVNASYASLCHHHVYT